MVIIILHIRLKNQSQEGFQKIDVLLAQIESPVKILSSLKTTKLDVGLSRQ